MGHVYDGANLAAEPLKNGVFGEIASGGVKAIATKKDTILRVEEKTDLWGMEALRLNVVSVGEDEVYLIENEWDYYDGEEFDEAKYTQPVGRYVRMHRPLPGEQMLVSAESAVFQSLNVGDKVQPGAGGSVAKVS